MLLQPFTSSLMIIHDVGMGADRDVPPQAECSTGFDSLPVGQSSALHFFL